MKRKPKAFRVTLHRWEPGGGPSGEIYAIGWDNDRSPRNATCIPDGAPLPMAREVRRLVTAVRRFRAKCLMAECSDREFGNMWNALTDLDRARKGRK